MSSAAEVNNGLKKEVSSKDVARIWVNDDMKMRSFSPVNVRQVIYVRLRSGLALNCVVFRRFVLAGSVILYIKSVFRVGRGAGTT